MKSSTSEVGGRVLDLNGAQYMIRGMGYLHSLSDLETVSVGSKGGTPIFLRDLGTVNFGPDIREGVADWNGEGETVGGIVVMRQGMNALNVIEAVKKKLKEIGPSLPEGVQNCLRLRSFWLDPAIPYPHSQTRSFCRSDYRKHRLPGLSLPHAICPYCDRNIAGCCAHFLRADGLAWRQFKHHVTRRSASSGYWCARGRRNRDG